MEALPVFALAALLVRLRREDASFYEVPGIVPLLLLLTYLALQIVPLPSVIVKLVSPEAYSLCTEAEDAAQWCSLSATKKATLREFFRLASYIAFYILTIQLLKKKDIFQRTIAILILFASCLAFLSILQHIFSNNKIFWIRELTQGRSPFGPYVNRNHYAGLMEMIFPVVIAMFLFYRPDSGYGSLRGRVAQVFNQKITSLHILIGLSAVVIATSIFVSLSRGGIISLSLSMMAFGIMFSRGVGKNRRGALLIFIVVLILYAVGWFGWDPIFERFEKIRNERGGISELRPQIWSDSIKLIKDFPVTGAGFGSFAHVYPTYGSVGGKLLVDHAHNDYIELLAEGGIIAGALGFWFLAAVVQASCRTIMKRREPYSIHLYIGAISGMISLLIHGLTDFNLHIGANGLYFFFFAGLAVSAAHTRIHQGAGETMLAAVKSPSYGGFGAVIIGAAGLTFNIGILLGNYVFSSAVRSGPPKEMRAAAYKASVIDPLDAWYHYAIAGMESASPQKAFGLDQYRRAVQLDPANGPYIQALGTALSRSGRNDAADKLFRAGIARDIRNPGMYTTYASWLFERGDMESGFRNMKKAISLDPGGTRKFVAIMVLHGLKDLEIRNALPEMVEPRLSFADYLRSTGNEEMADSEYLTALDYIRTESEIKPSFFLQSYRYYADKGMNDHALVVMKKAVEALPENAGIRLTSAVAFEKAGMTHRAAEEYRMTLVLDPNNAHAKIKLRELK